MLKRGIRPSSVVSALLPLSAILALVPVQAFGIQIRADQMQELLVQDSDLEFEVIGKDTDHPQLKIRGHVNPYIKNSIRFSVLPMNQKNEVKLIPMVSDQAWGNAPGASKALDYAIQNRCAMGESVTYPIRSDDPAKPKLTTLECSDDNTAFEATVSLSAYKNKKAPIHILYGRDGEEIASYVSEKVLDDQKKSLKKLEEAARGNINCPDCDARAKEDRLSELERQLSDISSVVADDDKKEALRAKLAEQRKRLAEEAKREAATKKEEALFADIEKLEGEVAEASISKLTSLRARALGLKRRINTDARGKSDELNDRVFKVLEDIANLYADAGKTDALAKTTKEMRTAFKKDREDDIKTIENRAVKRLHQKEYSALRRQARDSVQNGTAGTFVMAMQNEVAAAETARAEACADREAGVVGGAGVLTSDACTQATAHLQAIQNIAGMPQRILLGGNGAQNSSAMWGIANPNAQAMAQNPSALAALAGQGGIGPSMGNLGTLGASGNPSALPHLMFPNTAGLFQSQALVNPLGAGAMPMMGQQQNPFAMGLMDPTMGQVGQMMNPASGMPTFGMPISNPFGGF